MANYQFIDTNEVSEGAVLPSEALRFNGEYIENLIAGYRTLYVSGREALSPEISTYETGNRDGSTQQGKRFPARTIVVGYQLIAATNEDFRAAYNQLAAILSANDAELIFADEPDKFFIGTPSAIGAVEPGRNAVKGELEILCVDPFKYSVIEYEAQPSLDESSVLIDYGGTYKARPILEADFYSETEVADDGETAGTLTGAGDCGFVAFFTEDEKIIQLGDPDEVDGESGVYEKSQTLINQTFPSMDAWGTTAQSLWEVNNGVVLPATAVQTGAVGMAVSDVGTTATAKNTAAAILESAASTASSPTIYYSISAKSSKRTAATVQIDLAITTRLRAAESFFGKGYGLKGSVYFGGAWRDATLKSTSANWRGNSGHTVNISFTVSGLTADTTVLKGIKFKVVRTDGLGTAGTLGETACKDFAISAYATETPANYYLHTTNYGTADGQWHGASTTRTLAADAAGEVGAANFTLTYKQKLCIGQGANATDQLGGFHVHLSTADGTVVAGVLIRKNTNGRSGTLRFYINGATVGSTSIDLSHDNEYFGADGVRNSTIKKAGDTVRFTIGGYDRTFTDDAITDLKVAKVTFMFEQYGSSPALEYNGLHSAKFVKNNCDTTRDIPNKFSANDVVEADCNTGEIRLNGMSAPELGALGNDWEGFVLTPGLNQIGLAYSNWVPSENKPTFKVRYREVFL